MEPKSKPQTREDFIKSLFVLENEDNLITGIQARKKLIKGIDTVVDAIKPSYGASGSNCIVEAFLPPYYEVTNDGKKIVEQIKLGDRVENIGANIVKECAEKSDRESGDGRKTSMILLQAIIHEGMKCKEDPMEIKRSLDECLPIIIKEIDAQTKKITANEVGKIAEIASESKKLGSTFQEIYEKIGKEGIVELDNSGLPETFYEITEGVRLLNCGFLWPYMANEDKGRKAVYKAPDILITKQKLNNITDLDNIIRQVHGKGRGELVIFCDEIELSVSQALAYLHAGVKPDGSPINAFKTLIIKAPTLWKDWLFEDFAKITKATIIDPAQGKTLKNFQYAWLGYCDKIVTSKEETVVLGTQDITEHLENLAELNTDDAKIRIARLQTKTAILKLGANSESELSYIKGKALDARNASYLALNHGVVRGAGLALIDVVLTGKIPPTIGGNILIDALYYPNEQIRENMGDDFKAENLKGIFDPSVVVKNSLTNALSIAGTVLTTKNVITIPKR